MSNQHLHNLSEQIFEIREKFTDEEYRNLMDSLKKAYEERPTRVESEDSDSYESDSNRPRTMQTTATPLRSVEFSSATRVQPQPQNQYKNEYCSCCREAIQFIKHRCNNCPNYSLCDSCNSFNMFNRAYRLHDQNHTFTRIDTVEYNGWSKVPTSPKKNDCSACTIM